MAREHFEEYACVTEVMPDRVLVSWGGFYFRHDERRDAWDLVDDEDLPGVSEGRRETIGARSEPYGRAVVEVRSARGETVARAETADRNHAWVHGLRPDTEYGYRITVDGRPWAEGERWDWVPLRDPGRASSAATSGGAPRGPGGLQPSGRRYDLRFRTHADAAVSSPLTFAVLGDYGFGVRTADEAGERQYRVARSLRRAVEARGVRLVVTTGDNVYLGRSRTPEATGREDDDWFFSYYQPYRYVVSRVPVYPAVGNHDASDTEHSDDRAQLNDNFFLAERFRPGMVDGRASLDPGLFYRFDFGADFRFVAVDTTRATELESTRFFNDPRHVRFLEAAMPPAPDGPRWIVPFSHHPALCAGPKHHNLESYLQRLLPLARRSGVRLVLAGHEHNFQHQSLDGIHFVVTGAGGKLRRGRPDAMEQAHLRAWADEGHFLLVEGDRDELRLRPVGGSDEGAEPRPVAARRPDGTPAALPVVVRRD